ncbi:hypothetical protein RHMOL_Rhmol02G0149600 [Rhododendron molle]|uniref:Uncharacterized protein n=1 Tax=Rhododendron molle TaxID=49168 RepID=A0ACC0PPZ5_RHOML|nr:hypothetical protein RHMOL_Rhmol02G0149600 [Rhododendron molle]
MERLNPLAAWLPLALLLELVVDLLFCGAVDDFTEVIFESDYQNLINSVGDLKMQCSWEIEAIVNDIREWAVTKRWSFVWCGRKYNSAEH